MKVEILNEYNYQCYIPRENMVEIPTEELDKIGKGYKFDLATKTIVIDTEYQKEKEQEETANRIAELKSKLSQTDYQAIKYAEGYMTEEEYVPIKVQRKAWRDEINRLEEEMKENTIPLT